MIFYEFDRIYLSIILLHIKFVQKLSKNML